MPERTFRIKNRLPFAIYLVAALLPNAYVFGGDYAEVGEDESEDPENLLPRDARLGRLTATLTTGLIDESQPWYGIEELERLEDEMPLWSAYLAPLDDDADAPKPDKVYRMQPNGWFTVVLKSTELPGWNGRDDLEEYAGGTFDADMDVNLDTVQEPGLPPTMLIVAASHDSQN